MLEEESVCHSEPTLYTIEGNIHFCPNENTLRNVIDGRTVTLLSTASECFKILIENQGRVISRDEMKELVWGKRGVIVSSNTFYQNMLNLRRGLEKVGAGKRLISTHYGKGVTIDNGLDITPIVTTVSNCLEPMNGTKNIPFSTSEAINTADEHFLNNFKQLEEKGIIKKNRYNHGMILITNLLLLFFCILMFYTAHNLKRENYFSHYTKTKLKVKNCDIYTDPALLNEHELNELLKQNPPDCEEGETLYLSSVYPIQRMSVIRCIGTFLPGEECESDYYLE